MPRAPLTEVTADWTAADTVGDAMMAAGATVADGPAAPRPLVVLVRCPALPRGVTAAAIIGLCTVVLGVLAAGIGCNGNDIDALEGAAWGLVGVD